MTPEDERDLRMVYERIRGVLEAGRDIVDVTPAEYDLIKRTDEREHTIMALEVMRGSSVSVFHPIVKVRVVSCTCARSEDIGTSDFSSRSVDPNAPWGYWGA